MAEDADDPTLFWVEPRERGVIPLDGFHVPQRLARTVRRTVRDPGRPRFRRRHRRLRGARPTRPKTWINGRIRRLYGELFDLGHCHTVEA